MWKEYGRVRGQLGTDAIKHLASDRRAFFTRREGLGGRKASMGKQRHLSSTSGTNASTQRADMLDVKECINRLFRSATASHAREGAVSESEMLAAKHTALDTDHTSPRTCDKKNERTLQYTHDV